MTPRESVPLEGPDIIRPLQRPLILASASPRRQEIMRSTKMAFEVVTSDAEMGEDAPDDPLQRALINARLKALDVAKRHADQLVIGADTVVALGCQALEKPVDAAHAIQMLEQLSGRQHQVYTALTIAVRQSASGPETAPQVLVEEVVSSSVTFRELTATDIAAYVASRDPLDKAGAYGIQSGGGSLVLEVLGSYLNVVGLPLARLLHCLSALGWTGPAKET
ncbi:MAG: Maf family protein [Armatimonadota bacterium]